MFENLTDKLERSFKLLKGQGRITEINIAETLKDVRRALLDADVHYKIAKSFTDTVKQKALGQDVLTAVQPGQMMVKIVHDELMELMGGEAVDIDIKANPAIILIAGLQGSGKTTFSGKLARLLTDDPPGLPALTMIQHLYGPGLGGVTAKLRRECTVARRPARLCTETENRTVQRCIGAPATAFMARRLVGRLVRVKHQGDFVRHRRMAAGRYDGRNIGL